MRKRHRTRSTATGLTLLLLLALAGCGGQNPLSDDVTLEVVAIERGDGAGNSSRQFWDELIGDFRRGHPTIDVDVDLYGPDAVDAEIRKRVRAGHAPDLAQTGGMFADWAKKDLLYGARDMMSPSTRALIQGSLVEAGSVRREQYGVPFSAVTSALFWNKDLFEKAGVEGPPRTWKELRTDARALKAVGVPTPYGLPLADGSAQDEVLSWTRSGGGGYLDEGGAYAFDSAKNVAALEWLRDELVEPGLTNPEPAKTPRSDLYGAFARGEVGMLGGDPSLIERARDEGVRFGTAPMPGRDGPSRTATAAADWTMAFQEGGHLDQVRALLDFVFEGDYLLDYARTHTRLPVTTGDVRTLRADREERQLWGFLDALGSARFAPTGLSTWSRTSARLGPEIGAAVEPGHDPADVLGRVQREAVAAATAAGE
ncbi:extracellular solute-binding protein [Streptomyces sp. TR02-1]|uniref:extracellular solute-binding protein n=1 Tax=Streptomyces sp. TR02-1 TaxID=3385977 RepID=UPI0039A3D9D9